MEFETLPLSISFDEHASSDFLDMPCDDFSIFAAASDGEKHLEEELSWEALTEIVNNVIEESQQIPQSTVLEDVLNFNKQLYNLFNEVSRPATSTE
jgi:1-deoxy-D-xylulose 5-phosphate reductoisomerase